MEASYCFVRRAVTLCRDCDGCHGVADGGIALVGFGNQRGVFQVAHEEGVSKGRFSAIQL